MSVINKMLRDLDARQLPGGTGVSAPEVGSGMMRGTASVQNRTLAPARGPIPARFLRWLAALLLLAAAGAAGWYLKSEPNPQSTSKQVAATVSGVAGAMAPAPAASAAVMAPPASSTTPAPQPPTSAPVVALTTVKEVASASPPSPVHTPTATVKPPKVALLAAPHSAAASQPLPAGSTPVATGAAPPSSVQRQTAAQETLAQAQTLWASGSREAALELLREAVVVAERSHSAGSPVLASLVRELARLELAEGRAKQVLALLTRLEPVLSDQADLWAVRGNAAQRLGLHQEAAQAYLAALKSRPDESRWMLGAAVSLAAQGQLAAAAEWVEKARAAGVVSPEILAYLRQAGVPLRDR